MNKNEPRLHWTTKPTTVERLALPFQVVETINESRATREAYKGSLLGAPVSHRAADWRNKLIWGDNKLVAASLLHEFGGAVDLIYIDPPFDTGTDFSYRVRIGDEQVTKRPSIIEEHAYSDTWGAGRSSYLRMMFERIVLARELLSGEGNFFVHCAPNVSHYLKVVCDEVFGPEAFRSEIIWKRTSAHSSAKRFGPVHDVILFYARSPESAWFPQHEAYEQGYIAERFTRDEERPWKDADLTGSGIRQGETGMSWRGFNPTAKGRHWAYPPTELDRLDQAGLIYWPKKKGGWPRLRRYLDESKGVALQDVWTDIPPVNAVAKERVGYETQKPIKLVERIILTTTEPSGLVCDLFCGSGTTAVAAEQLGRRWIVADLGRFAIHTARKRLLNVPDCSPFEILNLGAYERQHWQHATTGGEIDAYLDFILALYEAQAIKDYDHLHGKKADRFVHIGAVDAPVTIDEIEEVMDELAANDLRCVDVLGWEWEMGLHDVVTERARRRGLDLACRQIPREVMKANLGDEVRFFELAYLDLEVDKRDRSIRVQLRDFVIPSDELIPEAVRSKIGKWSDYIDYWSVDFNFRDDTFHNEWQAYRTREEAKLAIESDWHDYEEPSGYAIVIKVIDIFGNDTTKLAEISIK